MNLALRVFLSVNFFAVCAFTCLLIYVFFTNYLFAKGLADPEWGWPIAGITFLFCLFSYSFALNRILVRLDP